MRERTWSLGAGWLCLLLAGSAGAQQNLLRNGSFEGSVRYWFNVHRGMLDANDAACGRTALRVAGDKAVQSGAFPLERGRPVTISMFVRAEKKGHVSLSLFPSHREIAQRAGLVWSRQGATVLPVTTTWRRVSATLRRDVKAGGGWWPNHTFMISLHSKEPFVLDGVTAAYDDDGKAYRPRRALEVVADAPDLPGFTSPSANLLGRGATVTVRAAVHNPGKAPRSVAVRWQVLDYRGRRTFGRPVERKVTVGPGGTVEQDQAIRLEGVGLMLIRVSALGAGGEVVDRSDLPLTVLPYPKAATKPHPAERFGAGVRGPHNVRLAQRIGFGWTRWYPHVNWGEVQKAGPGKYDWPDEKLADLAAHGITPVLVLYGLPKWARGAAALPKDMSWPADDKRWDDLSVETHFDRFVTAAVKRYAGRGYPWEFMNEPELMKLPPRVYFQFARRTARRVRGADPKAFFMVNSTWAGPTGLYGKFFSWGGAKLIDAFTWHDYSPGTLGDGSRVRRIRHALDEHGGAGVQIWFDEGWSFINSSSDYAAPEMLAISPAESAHHIVRSLTDMAAAGQEKAILFFLGYDGHGKSWWDYCAPGTELWDFAGLPTVGVATWNVLIHHLGLARPVKTILPQGAVLHVFEDKRNGRGVIVAWAETRDVVLPVPLAGVVGEDVMGNASPAVSAGPDGSTVLRLEAGRPIYVYARDGRAGTRLAEALAPLHEKPADAAEAGRVFRPPMAWQGRQKGTTKGNPYVVGGKPLWRLDRTWPADPLVHRNYRRMPWSGTAWQAVEHAHGGQPAATVRRGLVQLVGRGPWVGQPGDKLPALVFIAPRTARYRVDGEVSTSLWYGGGKVKLLVLLRDDNVVAQVRAYELESNKPRKIEGLVVQLEAAQELIFIPGFGRHHVAGTFELKGLSVSVTAENATAAPPKRPR